MIGTFDVFAGSETDSIRRVLDASAPACATGVSWTVSVYEGPDLGGTHVTLEGPALSMITSPWTQERAGRYSMALMRDGIEWGTELQDCVESMIRRSS